MHLTSKTTACERPSFFVGPIDGAAHSMIPIHDRHEDGWWLCIGKKTWIWCSTTICGTNCILDSVVELIVSKDEAELEDERSIEIRNLD